MVHRHQLRSAERPAHRILRGLSDILEGRFTLWRVGAGGKLTRDSAPASDQAAKAAANRINP